MVKLLKCINQEMLSPGVMNLRATIYEKFPFKDIKGGWSVVIMISEKEYRVTHVKKEQSYETKDEGQFTFEWIVDIPFKKSDLENFAPVTTGFLHNQPIKTLQDNKNAFFFCFRSCPSLIMRSTRNFP